MEIQGAFKKNTSFEISKDANIFLYDSGRLKITEKGHTRVSGDDMTTILVVTSLLCPSRGLSRRIKTIYFFADYRGNMPIERLSQ